MAHAHLDELDLALIGYLQQNGRMSLITLAEKLRVSNGTVRNRLDRLLANRIVSIVAIVDPTNVGYSANVHMGIRADLKRMAAIERELTQLEEVNSVAVTAGRYDFVIWANFTSDHHLRDFIINKFSKIKGIRFSETSHILSWGKRVWQWRIPVSRPSAVLGRNSNRRQSSRTTTARAFTPRSPRR
jgi:Lrp/AsnC family transcriptional regulator, regulator for asnA, asnC and gidA